MSLGKRLAYLIVVCCACRAGTSAAPDPVVNFLIDAPLCSSMFPVEFLIDGTTVGTDTFLVNLTSHPHTRSRDYSTPPGPHTVSARTGLYSWPQKMVMLESGTTYTDTLPFYCS